MKRFLSIILLIILIFIQAGCSSTQGAGTQGQIQEITVFAAASLTESFTELASDFEKQEGGKVKVVFNFAGSQSLKASVENGAKADIFASASTNYMEDLKKGGFVDNYSIFAKNSLVLIRNKNSKYAVAKLNDLSAEGIKIAVGDKSVPVGMYWEKAFEAASKDGSITAEEKSSIDNNIKTKELNVKDVVGKVVLNEADAGIVYKTDVTAGVADKVEEVDLTVFSQFSSLYPVAVLKNTENMKEAQKFYEYLLSDKGKAILEKYKFITAELQ